MSNVWPDLLTYPPKMTALEKRLTPEDFLICHRSLGAAVAFQKMNAQSETDYRVMRFGVEWINCARYKIDFICFILSSELIWLYGEKE